MAWKKGPLPPGTYYWGGVVPVELGGKPFAGGGFFFADFCGDHVVMLPGDPQEQTLKPHEVAWYDNGLGLPPPEAGVTGRAGAGGDV
jgi:hypothetical protein